MRGIFATLGVLCLSGTAFAQEEAGSAEAVAEEGAGGAQVESGQPYIGGLGIYRDTDRDFV
ncbi:MAG TPA: hypothetical protein VNJ47_11745, partial [Nevskiales bacterium]|nr:hypothetical protein [Nevskiales bacterium]